ncbi:Magnesium-chelatase subunit ChlD [Galdieria sulphuraria]|nr:Magnesium-chelatase subunit ChlD [Galdieria sulphuraria]
MKPYFVQIPLNVTEDRLLGSVDIEESLSRGEPVFQPGILAKANRSVLYVDELNLLDDSIVNILLGVLADGQVVVEREGFSVTYPCEPLFIATYNVEEGEIRPHVLDRFAISLSVDNEPLTQDQRIEAVNMSNMFADQRQELISQFNEETQEMASRIIFSREFLNDVVVTKEQIEYLCTEASRGQCIGHRGEVFAVEAAKASAALDNRDYVSEEDLRTAVKLVLVPRAMSLLNNEQQSAPEPKSAPPPPPSSSDNEEEEEEETETKEQEETNFQVPEEFLFDPEGGIVDPNLLQFASKQNSGRSGKRGKIYSFDRGRYIKPVLPRGDTWRIALDATLRAAAPLQKIRRERYMDITSSNDRRVYIRNQDIRIKKMSKKAGTLVIFLVDASGSMALNRMNAAKGAAIRLLSSAYESRDKISLISFQGENAQVLLPPTRSVAMAKRRMETMPCGGGSPLTHGLFLASKVGIQALSSGDVGQAIIVLISDGRANISLSQSLGEAPDTKKSKAELKQEVLDMARKIAALAKVKLLCIDTENKFVSTGIAKEIANAANGNYNYLPKATDSAVASLAGQVISSIKSNF